MARGESSARVAVDGGSLEVRLAGEGEGGNGRAQARLQPLRAYLERVDEIIRGRLRALQEVLSAMRHAGLL